jgi:hypothetical protein
MLNESRKEINPFDYDADARDRIWRLLEVNNVAYRDRLKQSADTAGAQLELAKPSVMGGHPLYAGPAVLHPPGTVLIVLAHHEKVFTIHLRAAAGHTFAECMSEITKYVRDIMEDDAEKHSGEMLGGIIENLIKKYRQMPSLNGAVELDTEHNARIIGTLFLPIPNAARAEAITGFQNIINEGICPAWVGLLGDGSQTGLCLVWPLPIALAPYADTVIKEDKKRATRL